MPGPYFQSVAPILEDELDNTVLSCLFVLMVMHRKTRVKLLWWSRRICPLRTSHSDTEKIYFHQRINVVL